MLPSMALQSIGSPGSWAGFIAFVLAMLALASLSLRSLFFRLGGVVDKLRYLRTWLVAVLVFVGAAMTLLDVYKVLPLVSLLIIATLSSVAIAASLWVSHEESSRKESSPAAVG